MQDQTSERSSIRLQNIRSASQNVDEFRVDQKEEKTLENCCNCSDRTKWLTDNSVANVYKLDGFNSPIRRNQARRGGGVSVSVKDKLKLRVVENVPKTFCKY